MAEYIERLAIGKAYMDLCLAKSKQAKSRKGATFFPGDLLPETEPTTKELFRLVMAMPAADVAPVVRCKDCKWYDPEHILLNDGGRGEYDEYPKNDLFGIGVTSDIGINVGGRCMHRGYINNLFREPGDFCSHGEHVKDGDNQ